MKGLIRFIKRLTGTLEKNTVLEQVKKTRSIVQDTAMPLVKEYNDYFISNPVESKKGQLLLKQFSLGYGERLDAAKATDKIYTALGKLDFGKLEKLADDILEEINMKEAMSVKSATIIRVSEYATFVGSYTLDLLMALTIEEDGNMGGNSKSEAMPPAKLKDILENSIFFGRLIRFFYESGDKLYDDFNNLPDEIVSADEKIASFNERNYGAKSKILASLPTKDGFVGNIIYHARLQVAEWEVWYHEWLRDYKKTLERRLLRLKERKKGEEDPALEKEIKYYEKKISKLEYKLKKKEEEVMGK
jgi:hypothetical protein